MTRRTFRCGRAYCRSKCGSHRRRRLRALMRASNCPKAFQPCLLPGGCGRNAFGSAEGVTAIDTVDADFRPDMKGLTRAIDLLNDSRFESAGSMPEELPSAGLGCSAALEALAPLAIGGAARLDAPH